MGGGMEDSMRPMFPPTPVAMKHRNVMLIVAFIHLFLNIAVMIVGGAQFGFTSLLTVMCLFCATMNYNFCCVLIYIVYTGFDWIGNIDPVGLYVQNSL